MFFWNSYGWNHTKDFLSTIVSFIQYYLWKTRNGDRLYLVLLLENVLIYEYIKIIHSNWTFEFVVYFWSICISFVTLSNLFYCTPGQLRVVYLHQIKSFCETTLIIYPPFALCPWLSLRSTARNNLRELLVKGIVRKLL